MSLLSSSFYYAGNFCFLSHLFESLSFYLLPGILLFSLCLFLFASFVFKCLSSFPSFSTNF